MGLGTRGKYPSVQGITLAIAVKGGGGHGRISPLRRVIFFLARDEDTVEPMVAHPLAVKGNSGHATLRDAIGHLQGTRNEARPLSPTLFQVMQYIPAGGNWRSIPAEHQPAWLREKVKISTDWVSPFSLDEPAHPYMRGRRHQARASALPPRRIASIVGRGVLCRPDFTGWFLPVGSGGQKYKQLGNAVPVKSAQAIGEHLKQHMTGISRPALERSVEMWKRETQRMGARPGRNKEEKTMAKIHDIGAIRVNDHIHKFLRGYESLTLPLLIEHFAQAIEEEPEQHQEAMLLLERLRKFIDAKKYNTEVSVAAKCLAAAVLMQNMCAMAAICAAENRRERKTGDLKGMSTKRDDDAGCRRGVVNLKLSTLSGDQRTKKGAGSQVEPILRRSLILLCRQK